MKRVTAKVTTRCVTSPRGSASAQGILWGACVTGATTPTGDGTPLSDARFVVGYGGRGFSDILPQCFIKVAVHRRFRVQIL